MTMRCADVTELLDAFVDSELPPGVLLDVARHAGQCAQCDATVQDLLAVREAVVADADRLLQGVDLSPVWASVDTEITRREGQAAWRRRVEARHGTMPRRATIWGSIAAIAAGAALVVGTPALHQSLRAGRSSAPPEPTRVVAKRLPNHVYIDRLAGKDIALRREPKSGTTMIWVNHEVDSSGW